MLSNKPYHHLLEDYEDVCRQLTALEQHNKKLEQELVSARISYEQMHKIYRGAEDECDHLKEKLAVHQRMLAGGILYSIEELVEHDADLIGNLKFPTMFRKMWSSGEVQAWLKEQANLIRQKAQEV